MISSSKTEYAFWKLKILCSRSHRSRTPVIAALEPTSLIHTPAREIEGWILVEIVSERRGGLTFPKYRSKTST